MADETISLSAYLQLANKSGLRIVYSSSLVPAHLLVTVDEDNIIGLAQVRRVLSSFDLVVEQVGKNNFVVKRDRGRRLLVSPGDSSSPSFTPVPIMEEIVVSSSLYKLMRQNTINLVTLGHEDLARRPAIGNDALRTVNQLPGSASIGVSVKPRVRGGNEDETLVNFNGVRLYEPFHLQEFSGLFSTVDSRVINSLEFMSGGFPVDYGDRLSAVLQINTVTAQEMGEIREASIGLYTGSYLQSGGEDGRHYLIDVRRSSIDGIASLAENDFGTPTFGDAYVRYDWEFTGGQSLSANLLWFGDDISINDSSGSEKSKSLFGNTYLWVDYVKELSKGFDMQSILSWAAIKDDREGQINKPGQVVGRLLEDQEFRIYSFDHKFTWTFQDHGLLKLGFVFRYLDAEYSFISDLQIDPAFNGLSNFTRPSNRNIEVVVTGRHLGVYSNYKWLLFEDFYVETGFRVDWQDYVSGITEQISPRINFLYRLSDATELRFSWGKFAQVEGIHELKISDGLSEFQAPQKSIHSVVSLTHIFDSGLRVRIEAYEKNGVDNNSYFENLTNSVTLLPELQVDRFLVKPDDFTAKGVEVTVDGYTENFEWWANYSLSSAKDHINGINVRRSWDQENSANAGISTHWDDWQHTLSATYHTGWSTTPLVLQGSGLVQSLQRNGIRFSNYVSVDLKSMKTWRFSRGRSLRLEAGLTNILNRKNQIGIEYKIRNGNLVSSDNYALPLVPFADVYWRF